MFLFRIIKFDKHFRGAQKYDLTTRVGSLRMKGKTGVDGVEGLCLSVALLLNLHHMKLQEQTLLVTQQPRLVQNEVPRTDFFFAELTRFAFEKIYFTLSPHEKLQYPVSEIIQRMLFCQGMCGRFFCAVSFLLFIFVAKQLGSMLEFADGNKEISVALSSLNKQRNGPKCQDLVIEYEMFVWN